jgi:aminoglycoside phosphotransferase (APT) family kinase protein
MTSEQFQQLVQKLDSQSNLLQAWQLHGGVSAQVTALEIEQPQQATKKIVVRQYGALDLQQNPNIAAHEFRLLQGLYALGLAVPMPYFFDQTGEIFATPYLVIEYMEGTTEFAPADLSAFIVQMATQLSLIHAIDMSSLDLSFLPKQDQKYAKKFSERPLKLDDSLAEGRIRDVLEAVWPFPQPNKTSLLHGDFWPGNLLWQQGQLIAVIDWEDAELGDPLAEVAITRLELLWAFGKAAMTHFTQQYRSLTALDFTSLPYWDLCAALRPAFKLGEWAADDLAEKRMRARHHWFITQAFHRLTQQGKA